MTKPAITFEEFVCQAGAELSAGYAISLEEGMVGLDRLMAFHSEGSSPSDWVD